MPVILRNRLFSFISKRRQVFKFDPLEYDTKLTVRYDDHLKDTSHSVEIPLESHPMGSYGPSLVPFNEGLLEDLACPISGTELKFDRENNVLISEVVGVAFPINNAGIPLFLKKWAIPLNAIKNKI